MNNYFKLEDVADVKLSNVDKKVKTGEKEIRLCNYTDVYKNTYIDKNRAVNFMIASCNEKEFEKFLLKKGQVSITKDSEKANDIGVSTYIEEDFQDVVLGYHLALITPYKEKLDGKYLNYWFNTSQAKRYFENNVGGSGQRFTLPLDVILSTPLCLPNIEKQKKISSILFSLDKKIQLLHQINDNLAELAKTIYDYWFVQFDFPDENGKPYKSSGGKMVYNNVLKREIPEGWEVKRIGEFIDLERGVTYTKENISEKSFQNIGVLRATNISGNKIDLNNLVYISNKLKDSQILKQFDTLIVMSSGSKEHIGKNGIYYFSEQNAFGAFCAKIRAKEKMVFEFINVFLQSESFKVYIKNQCLGTNINNLNNTHILLCPILKPADNILELYHYNTKNIFQKIAYNTQQIQHLQSLRDWLLPMLMNGQISVE